MLTWPDTLFIFTLYLVVLIICCANVKGARKTKGLTIFFIVACCFGLVGTLISVGLHYGVREPKEDESIFLRHFWNTSFGAIPHAIRSLAGGPMSIAATAGMNEF
jgi:hypothetical protein